MPKFHAIMTAESLVYSDEYTVTADTKEEAEKKLAAMLADKQIMLSIRWKPSGTVYTDSGKIKQLIHEDEYEEWLAEQDAIYAEEFEKLKKEEEAAQAKEAGRVKLWLPGQEMPVIMAKPEDLRRRALEESRRSALRAIEKAA